MILEGVMWLWCDFQDSHVFWVESYQKQHIDKRFWSHTVYMCKYCENVTGMVSTALLHLTQRKNPTKTLKQQLLPLMARIFITEREDDFNKNSWIYTVGAQPALEHSSTQTHHLSVCQSLPFLCLDPEWIFEVCVGSSQISGFTPIFKVTFQPYSDTSHLSRKFISTRVWCW